MKLIIAGSRDLKISEVFILELIKTFALLPTEIVTGGARGVDRAGEVFAHRFNKHELGFNSLKGMTAIQGSVPCNPGPNDYNFRSTVFEAEWEEYGKAAGPMRNQKMAKYADELLLIWDGKSKGSSNMKTEMIKLGKPVHEVIFPQLPLVLK